jgi:hypothetical protein
VRLEDVSPKRWPLVLVFGAAAAAVLFFVLRPAGPPAAKQAGQAFAQKVSLPSSAPSEANPTVLVRVQSSPAGASVLDEKDGSVLGMTPLQKSYPLDKATMGMILRLAGYKDKSIAVALDGNSSTTVELERLAAARAEVVPRTTVTHTEPRRTGGAHRPPKPKYNEEDEWRVH